MDLSKLKLEKFQTYNGFNIPDGFEVSLAHSDTPDVYFVFCETFEDINRYTNLLLNKSLPQEHRVFYIYKKGQRSFHRDHIYAYLHRSPFIKMKAPILSSLSKTYSCFACMIKK